MSITTEIRRTVADARAALIGPKPLHAVAGAGDLFVERVRTTVAAQQRALQSVRFQPSALPARMSATVDGVRGAVVGLPDHAQGVVVDSAARANRTYDGLARRGATLVGRVRRQAASQELGEQIQNTVRSAKTTTTTARKAGAATSSRAKATATSARKATSAATAATNAAVTKTGSIGAPADATSAPKRTSSRKTNASPKQSTSATKRAASPRKTAARKPAARKPGTAAK
ncbi:MAG: hypothetical protein H0V38_00405 [Sporichthyaceae bacterium]|nr:hypothetical protein [Sporichthyaceae bacterium]